MNSFSSIQYSRLYYDFIALDFEIYPGIVYFYERNEEEIVNLCFEEYFDILIAYTEALFQCEDFQKHIVMSDIIIDHAMSNNIKDYNGEDIFLQVLFRKAQSYYHLGAFNKATYILKELIHIDSSNSEYKGFLVKNMRADVPPYFMHLRATMMALFLMGSISILIEVLVIRNFYTEHEALAEKVRISCFLFGLLVMGIGYMIHYYNANQKANRIILHAVAKKSRKKNHQDLLSQN